MLECEQWLKNYLLVRKCKINSIYRKREKAFYKCFYCRMCACPHETTFGAAGKLWDGEQFNIRYTHMLNALPRTFLPAECWHYLSVCDANLCLWNVFNSFMGKSFRVLQYEMAVELSQGPVKIANLHSSWNWGIPWADIALLLSKSSPVPLVHMNLPRACLWKVNRLLSLVKTAFQVLDCTNFILEKYPLEWFPFYKKYCVDLPVNF